MLRLRPRSRTGSFPPSVAQSILVGGRVFTENPALASEIGADGTAADGQLAVKLAETLMASDTSDAGRALNASAPPGA